MTLTLSSVSSLVSDSTLVIVAGSEDGVPVNVYLRDADLRARVAKVSDDADARRAMANAEPDDDKRATKLATAERAITRARNLLEADVFPLAVAQHEQRLADHDMLKDGAALHGERYAAKILADDQFAADQTAQERVRLARIEAEALARNVAPEAILAEEAALSPPIGDHS